MLWVSVSPSPWVWVSELETSARERGCGGLINSSSFRHKQPGDIRIRCVWGVADVSGDVVVYLKLQIVIELAYAFSYEKFALERKRV